MKTILMIGQSNMAGRGYLKDVPVICNENIFMLRNGKWEMMHEPVNYDKPIAGVSLVSSFAELMSQELAKEQIGLIPCAEGGSTISDWSVEKPLFRHAVSEAKFAAEGGELTAILWHHGESDCMMGNYMTYAEKLKIIFNRLRSELGAPNVPIIIGGIGDYIGKTAFSGYCTEAAQINEAIKTFAAGYDNCYFVTAAGLTPNPDGIHMDAVSLRRFGVRYYEAYSKRKDINAPLDNENELLEKCYGREHTKEEKDYLRLFDFVTGKISFENFVS